MKICLIANYPADGQQSMLRYADYLERELTRRGHDVRRIQPRVRAARLVPQGNPLRKWLGYIDKFALFARDLPSAVSDAEVIHICDHSNSPYLSRLERKPRVITCHDALAIRSGLGEFQQNPTGWSGRRLQHWILKSLPKATLMLCVSEKTRQDFDRLLANPVPSTVVWHGLNWNYQSAPASEVESVRARLGLDGEYLLHVGSNQWYKNRLGVLKIFAELKKFERFRATKLVMAGRPFTPAMSEFCGDAMLADVVPVLGPENATLQALYTGALAFVFPSLEEGFGWPILEAQACGCMVFAADRAPLTEVAGDGAIYLPPDDPEAAAQVILAGVGRRSQLVEAGWRNLDRFGADAMFAGYEAAYARAVALHEQGGAVQPISRNEH